MPRRTAAAAAAAGPAADASLPLPPDLLAEVLRHLPMAERLRYAARVSRAWAAAATAATTDVRVEALVRSTPKAPPFERWLAAHGSQLTSLRLVGGLVQGVDIRGVVAGLPLGLTRLGLYGSNRGWQPDPCMTISSATCPRLGELTALRDLELAHVALLQEPGVLSGLSSLTRFVLKGRLSLPDQLQYTAAEAASTTKGTPALLRLLGQQTGLQHLDIEDALQHPLGPCGDAPLVDELAEEDDEDEEGPAVSGAYAAAPHEEPAGGDDAPYLLPLYSGLMHSSLRHLRLSGPLGCLLPKGAGAILFGRPGLRLQQLVTLDLRHMEPFHQFDKDFVANSFITPADLRSIIECCVGGQLRDLNLLGAVERGADYSMLSRLECLTSLSVVGADVDGVAQLTNLRSLDIVSAAPFDDVDVVGVVKSLTQLTLLSMDDVRLRSNLGDNCGLYGFMYRPNKPGMNDTELWNNMRNVDPVLQQVQRRMEADGVWEQLCAELEERQLRAACNGGG